jgi:hypothetical protein
LLRVDETKGVDARVVPLDLMECRLGSLDRGKLSSAVQLQELRGGEKSDIAHARALPLARLPLSNKRPSVATKLRLPRGGIASFLIYDVEQLVAPLPAPEILDEQLAERLKPADEVAGHVR